MQSLRRYMQTFQTDTTGVCEAFEHSSIKGGGLAEKPRLLGRRFGLVVVQALLRGHEQGQMCQPLQPGGLVQQKERATCGFSCRCVTAH